MSSEAVVMPSRVLRGAAAARVRGAVMGVDLTLLAPPPAPKPAPELVDEDPAEIARAAREEAARIGYQDGFAAGRQDAVLAAEAQATTAAHATAAALQSLDAATAALHQRQTVEITDVEQHVVTLALALAEAVIQREVAAAAAPGRDALLRALALAPERVDAVARVHPDDLATIGDLAPLTVERELTLVADPSVERGGCVLDVGPCRIDAQITPAIDRVRKALGA